MAVIVSPQGWREEGGLEFVEEGFGSYYNVGVNKFPSLTAFSPLSLHRLSVGHCLTPIER